ncbi:MAG: hypothetical protein EA421_10670 [Gemmatimonadales bacterium]|nr:MAG: hypothetical protein EA421_10670 [Gemmatimonadales bacterium]
MPASLFGLGHRSPMPLLTALALLPVLLLVSACGTSDDPGDAAPASLATNPHDAFLANLSQACGQAFPGVVTSAPDTDPYFSPGAELVLEFRVCSPDEVSVPVWMGDNGSRTWVFTRTGGGIDLRHDHRHPDGRSEPNTFYGSFVAQPPVATEAPSPNRHEFKRITDEGMSTGWVVEIIPGERYTYGTQRDGEWRHRFDFDLSQPVPSPGDPWGHPPVGTTAQVAASQAAFLDNLAQHCGKAFAGRLVVVPEGSQTFTGDEELIVHFRECGDNRLKLPFHADDDHSRTWIFTRTTAGIDLRHDHRLENGHPDGPGSTWYGAHTQADGTGTRQEFLREELRDGVQTGWRVEIVPNERYTYGTIRDGEWSFRADFDLTSAIETPSAPWGY